MYRNLKISKKLALTFAVATLLSAVTALFSIWSLKAVGGYIEQMFSGPYVASTASMGLRRDLNAIENAMRSAIIEKNPDHYVETMDSADQIIEQRVILMENSKDTDPQMLADLKNALEVLSGLRRSVVIAIESNNFDRAITLMQGEYLEKFKSANNLAIEINKVSDANAFDFHNMAIKQVQTNVWLILALFLINTLLAIGFAVATTKSIVYPLQELEKASDELVKGNLSSDLVTYQSKDEIGSLADSMSHTIAGLRVITNDMRFLLSEMAKGNFDVQFTTDAYYVGDFGPIMTAIQKIITELSEMLRQISQTADQVAAGSEQVSAGAQNLSQGAAEQASSVEELSATMGSISGKTEETAENARNVNELVAAMGDQIGACDVQMGKMLLAMGEISKKSDEVGKIIKAIEDIAFQTNILSLNAAVEAARAGTAGKGFAVVADEVRNLASRSANSARSTTSLIEDTMHAVENGKILAQEAAKSLETVVASSGLIVERVGRITQAAEEQAISTGQVTVGIEQIANVVQNNSATAQESAAASEQLSSQAQLLKEFVQRFRLNGHSL